MGAVSANVTELRGAKSFEFESVLKTTQKQRKDLDTLVGKKGK